jgi:hypothetical protein
VSVTTSDATSYLQRYEDAPAAPLLYKVSDAVWLLRMSRAFIYKQIKAGRLRTVKQGGSTFITAAALTDYVALLEREGESQP